MALRSRVGDQDNESTSHNGQSTELANRSDISVQSQSETSKWLATTGRVHISASYARTNLAPGVMFAIPMVIRLQERIPCATLWPFPRFSFPNAFGILRPSIYPIYKAEE